MLLLGLWWRLSFLFAFPIYGIEIAALGCFLVPTPFCLLSSSFLGLLGFIFVGADVVDLPGFLGVGDSSVGVDVIRFVGRLCVGVASVLGVEFGDVFGAAEGLFFIGVDVFGAGLGLLLTSTLLCLWFLISVLRMLGESRSS